MATGVELFWGLSVTKKQKNVEEPTPRKRIDLPVVETGHIRTHSSSSTLIGAMAMPIMTFPWGGMLGVWSAKHRKSGKNAPRPRVDVLHKMLVCSHATVHDGLQGIHISRIYVYEASRGEFDVLSLACVPLQKSNI